MKLKRTYGFKNTDDDEIICRRILLNTLKVKGPVMAERMFAAAAAQYGFCREQVLAAARYWNVIEEDRDGQVWWCKPDVLTCLPTWNYRPDRPRALRQA
jgi:hypothetical protein